MERKTQTRIIRDPIHGNIPIYETEEIILNAIEFQRLRYISQLSLCSLVYPGAVHNRFSHSLGVMHVSGEMYRSLTQNTAGIEFDYESYLAVRMASMLHDIGHGPFSHIFERGVAMFDSKLKKSGIHLFNHEEMGLRIIKELLYQKIDPVIRDLVVKLVEGKDLPDKDWYLAQIISSEVDSDRFDFLLRDSYYSGVTYGNFELNRLLETMTIANQPDDNKSVIVFKKKGLMALESFLFARYNMYRGVYFHHTNLIGDAMISRALSELIKRDLFPRTAIVRPEEFVKWNDTRIIGIFHDLAFSSDIHPEDPVYSTITGIVFRRLWKRLKIAKDLSIEQIRELIKNFAIQKGIEQDLISEIITVKKLPYSWIPIHFSDEIKADKPTKIFILTKNKRLRELTDVSQIKVPADFMENRQILVHPEFIQPLTQFIQEKSTNMN
ncbi:MAG: HD domain-containing protein [Candidatus Hodarchaeales archaeon]